MDKTSPQIIHRDGMIADDQYVGWLKELKQRYAQAQTKAAVKVNEGMLSFYWSLGKDILHMKAESKWGKGFFNQLSMDLRQGFGVNKGLFVTNLKYIKRWFEFYTKDNAIRQQAVDELEMPTDFAFVSWSQHIKIFTKGNDIEVSQLRSAEDAKIECARRHFAAISTQHRDALKDQLLTKFGLCPHRISTTDTVNVKSIKMIINK